MMLFFILLGIAIVVTFVALGYKAAAKAAAEPDSQPQQPAPQPQLDSQPPHNATDRSDTPQ